MAPPAPAVMVEGEVKGLLAGAARAVMVEVEVNVLLAGAATGCNRHLKLHKIKSV